MRFVPCVTDTFVPPPLATCLCTQELSQDPQLVERLVASLAPNIWEMEDIKKGVLCQLFGGLPKVGACSARNVPYT